jgi:hypothetical protein
MCIGLLRKGVVPGVVTDSTLVIFGEKAMRGKGIPLQEAFRPLVSAGTNQSYNLYPGFIL